MDAVSSARPGLRRWHRRIAWMALMAAFTFALTGLLHPLMTRLQPKPAQFKPPAVPRLNEALPAPATALSAAGIAEVSGLRPVHDGNGWLWRVQALDGRVRYLDPTTGAEPVVDAERAHAERLARWYAGESTADVSEATVLTAFDGDYGWINRLLPVWRVRFARDDGLTVYVSTTDDRLATISDTRKAFFQQTFRAVHSWSWLPAPLRNAWINTLLAAVAGTTLFGLTLALRTPGGRRFNLRRLHRLGGITVSLAVLAWAVSGFVQTLGNAERERADSPQRPLRVQSAHLSAPLHQPPDAASGATLVTLHNTPVWRWALTPPETTTGRGLAMGEHQHHGQPAQAAAAVPMARYMSALDGQEITDGEIRHLSELITHFGLQGRTAAATPVLKFTPDYGFAFKRLPVWRLEQPDAEHTAAYLDTSSERLAATVTDGERTAGALFAYAHKWEWVTPWAGKDWRDGLSAFFAFLLIGVAVGGTLLRRRRKPRVRRSGSS